MLCLYNYHKIAHPPGQRVHARAEKSNDCVPICEGISAVSYSLSGVMELPRAVAAILP